MLRGSALLGLLFAVCSRTPEEPIAPTPPVATVTTAAASAVPKCIRATPDAPPPTALPAARCPPDPLGGPPSAPIAPLRFSGGVLQAEVARSSAETERGLMYRTSMAEEHGMIFVMPHEEHTFWMHNTCIPLDMLFVDDDGTIVGILENVPTLNDDQRTVGCESTYVIETNAGWCRRHGVKAGQKVELPKL
jgi:uncharacterized protein